jgi:DNA helicase IV
VVTTTDSDAVREEQRHVDRAYARLEQLRRQADRRRREALAADVTTHADLVERDAAAHEAATRLRTLTLGDLEPLVFGRLDREEGETHHIGRVSVLSEDYEPLVVDWRSEVAAPFYRATPVEPLGVRRRRIIQCRGSEVLAVEDQLLDLEEGVTSDDELVGDAALMAAVLRDRSDRMRDIVATIQREQDEIIRQPARGIVVVAGGPGTGKTAVALHRVAYLLYRHRERLTRRGVLVIGPSNAFTSYIERVLPGLGETRAILRPLGSLVAGLDTDRHDRLDVSAIKGRVEMAEVARRLAAVLPARTGAREGFERLRSGEVAVSAVAPDLLDTGEVDLLERSWREDHETGRAPSVDDVAIIDELRALRPQASSPEARTAADGGIEEEVTTFADRTAAVDPGELIVADDYADFGHVVVDEAQDLSVMQWRMVARRGPAATWTVVGDLAQRSAPATPSGWDEVAAIVGRRELVVARLTVNYRTSAAIMDVAAQLLPLVAPRQDPPRSVRPGETPPRVLTGVEQPADAAQAEAVAARRAVSGTVAVVAPGKLEDELRDRLRDEDVRVLSPWTAKGLEFDAVVVVAPEEVVEAAGHGGLYVALTRATERLSVVTGAARLPDPLESPSS